MSLHLHFMLNYDDGVIWYRRNYDVASKENVIVVDVDLVVDVGARFNLIYLCFVFCSHF